MLAPERLVQWLSTYQFVDRRHRLPPGMVLQYHPRSDEHSKALAEFIVEDLLDTCEPLRVQAAAGEIAYGVNVRFLWPNGKEKTLDLAIGIPVNPQAPPEGTRIHRVRSGRSVYPFSRLFLACEEKSTMTEHGKSQPRIYSELNDAHTIVHQGSRDTIAAGLSMVNIATTFISPTRQRPDQIAFVSVHRQPGVTANMVAHLRRLPLRASLEQVGFEAYSTFVVDADHQGQVRSHTEPPAPQPGDLDHYEAFLTRICYFYQQRFSDLATLPPESGLSVEEAFHQLGRRYPSLLKDAAQLAEQAGLDGATDLRAILEQLEPPPADGS
jgi:hypothetical protein